MPNAMPSTVAGVVTPGAIAHPDRPALLFRGREVSYAALEAHIRRAATGLAALGLARGDRLALFLANGPEFVVAYYAAMRLGLRVVPVNPTYGEDELAYLVADCGAAAVVTGGAQVAVVEAARRRCPDLREVVVVGPPGQGQVAWEDLLASSGEPPAVDVVPDDDALVFYTSGTTGRPKGAVVTHRNVMRFAEQMQAMPGTAVAPGERTLLALPVFHMFAQFSAMNMSLVFGGTLVVLERFTATGYADAVTELDCTRLFASPPMVIALLQLPDLASRDFSRVRCLFSGGAPTPVEVARQFKEATGVDVDECYGSNEALMIASTAAAAGRRPGRAGAPIPGVEVRVVDDAGHEVPRGQDGEIVARGNAFSGYWGRPEETARTLRDGWCHTGDVGRMDDDGQISVVDRKKDLVNVGGTKVWPREVEEVLFRHPAVQEAAVVAWPDATMGELPVAFVVLREDQAASEADLRTHCAAALARYKVPIRCFVRAALPKLPSGKVLRRALREEAEAIARREPPKRRGTGELVLPETLLQMARDDREQRLVTYLRTKIARMLHLAPKDLPEDVSFVELGLDSLMAIELRYLWEDDLGLVLPASDAWNHPTLRALACHLADRLADEEPTPTRAEPIPADVAGRHDPFPMTEMQQAYWIGGQPGFDLCGLDAHAVLEASCGPLDLGRLERSWNQVVARHDLLRAVATPDGQLRVVPEVPPYAIAVEDLVGLAPDEQAERLAATRRRLADHGSPMDRWPLFQIVASQLAPDRWRLHFAIDLLVCDGRSVAILFADWGRFYGDPEAELAPLSIGFRDWVLATEGRRGSPSHEAARAYWQARLATLPPPPDLPLALAPAEVTPVRFEHLAGELAAETWQRLKARARQAGVTPTAVLVAAFAEALAGWARHPEFTLNLLFFNRQPLHPQIGQVVGNFSSTLYLAVQAGPDAPFAARCRRLHRQLWTDLEHAEVSGVALARDLARQRGWTGAAVAPVAMSSMLGLDDGGEGPWRPVWSDLVDTAVQTPQVHLDHQVLEKDGALRYAWDHVAGLFPEGLVEAMFGAYEDLLRRLADDPTAWDAPAPLVVPPPAFLAGFNATARAWSEPEALLHAPFLAQAERRPDALAVVAPERALTYGGLASAARRLARWLRAQGVAPGDLVAVVLDKGWEQAVAVLGVLMAGAAYVPVDPALPTERLHHLLGTTGARVAVTRDPLARRLCWPQGLTLATVDAPAVLALSDAPLDPVQGADDLAYVIFTSGSTGLPKGVMIDHRGALNTVRDLNARLALGPEDRVLALSALNFDLSVYDLFGPLTAGGAVVVPAAPAEREPAHWEELLHGARVTVWNSVPQMAAMLADHLEGRQAPLPAALRAVLVSGDWVPVTLPDRLRTLRPGIEVLALGGATEASIWSIGHRVEAVDPRWRSIPYGRPLANQTIHVLDEALEPCPVWRTGHLHIGGVGVARGYWRDPAKTAAAFFVHPRTGERLYRTGDLARMRSDGEVEFLGREDAQVKVQGYRIELGEVEAALALHPEVKAAVVACWGPREARYLVGYVVPSGPSAPSTASLREHLQAKLPAYMVPADFVALDALPLSANGKVDRRGLPVHDRRQHRDRVVVAPRTDLEARLAAVWEELLGVAPISVHDGFFELGGHSLLAVRLVGRIREAFGYPLGLGALLEGLTVAGLAERIVADEVATKTPAVVLRAEGEGPPLFLVHPVGGSVACYLALVRRLPGRPIYGLQAAGLEGPLPDDVTVEQLATRYVAAVRTLQPHGPYHLAGWSMGGVIASEMARQLEDVGEQTGALVLLDAEVPATRPEDLERSEALAYAFVDDVAGGRAARLAIDPAVLATSGDALATLLATAEQAGLVPGGIDLDRWRHLFAVYRTHLLALARHQPRAHHQPATLLVAAGRGAVPDPTLGWGAVLGARLRVEQVPGDHHGVVTEPHVAAIAERLEGALGKPGSAFAR